MSVTTSRVNKVKLFRIPKNYNQNALILIVVTEAKARSIALTHPQKETKQKETKIYDVWTKKILLHPWGVTNLNN